MPKSALKSNNKIYNFMLYDMQEYQFSLYEEQFLFHNYVCKKIVKLLEDICDNSWNTEHFPIKIGREKNTWY